MDEFVQQTYTTVDPGTQQPTILHDAWMLQDANYNVVGITNEASTTVEQYSWEPYGTLAAIDHIATPRPTNTVGHQGLFYYSFDGTGLAGATATGKGLYYNRNRWYSPKLGRFITPDPNESGQLLLNTMAMNGGEISLLAGALRPEGQYGSGLGLYSFPGSNPIRSRDPLGLYDPFDEADSIIADIQGGRAAAAEQICIVGDLAQRTGIAALQALVMAAIPGGALLVCGGEAYRSLLDIYENGLNWGNGLSLGLNSLAAAGDAVRLYKVIKQFTREQSLLGFAYGRARNMSLPSWRKVKIDMGEVVSGHTAAGSRVLQGKKLADLWPDHMSPKQIEKAILQAYKNAKKMGIGGGGRYLLHGRYNGATIEMYFDLETKMIETAYPLGRL